VQVYLFRDQGGSNDFACSTHSTGRNRRRPGAYTELRFVTAISNQNISPNCEDDEKYLSCWLVSEASSQPRGNYASA